jgi:hypothetical protein
MLSEVRQTQKDKGHAFFQMWKIYPKDKHIPKNKPFMNLYVEYVCNSRTTL